MRSLCKGLFTLAAFSTISALPVDDVEATVTPSTPPSGSNTTALTAMPSIIDPKFRIENGEKYGGALDSYAVLDAFLTAMAIYASRPFNQPLPPIDQFFNHGSKVARLSIQSEASRKMEAGEGMVGLFLCAQRIARAATPFKPAGCTLWYRVSDVEDRRVGFFVVSSGIVNGATGSSAVVLSQEPEGSFVRAGNNTLLVARSDDSRAEDILTADANGRWVTYIWPKGEDLLQIRFILTILEVLLALASYAQSSYQKERFWFKERDWATVENTRVRMTAHVGAASHTYFDGAVNGLVALVRGVKEYGRFMETDFEVWEKRGYDTIKTISGRISRS